MMNLAIIEKVIQKDKEKAMELLIRYFRKHPEDYSQFKKRMAE